MPSPSADTMVAKLIRYSRLADQRTYLKDLEQKRVDEAFQLLTNGRPPANAKGAKQKTLYLEALRNIRKKLGDTGVVLCAAGAGSSAIANMTEEERVFLPSKISEKWGEIKVDVFKGIAEGVSKGTSLTAVNGDVYELNIEDLKKITAMPGQISGIIRLTDPYNRYQSSFVTIPLSKELTDALIITRERITE